jgi:hypothetical protein
MENIKLQNAHILASVVCGFKVLGRTPSSSLEKLYGVGFVSIGFFFFYKIGTQFLNPIV